MFMENSISDHDLVYVTLRLKKGCSILIFLPTTALLFVMVLLGCNAFVETSFIITVNNLLGVGCATVP